MGVWSLIIVSLLCCVSGQTSFGTSYDMGEATYYTLTGTGNCGLEFTNAKTLPWTKGINNFIAMNRQQYDMSGTCGLCIEYRGNGQGSGQTQLPQTPQYAMVTDQVGCPPLTFLLVIR
jgi:hypothetical protein